MNKGVIRPTFLHTVEEGPSKKYRIRIFSSFCPSENCKDIYERLCEAQLMRNYGQNKDIYITNDEDYSHVIILNTAMPTISPIIPQNNVVGFAFEPPKFLNISVQFIEYAKKKIGKYFIGDANGLGEPFVGRYSHMWHNPPLTREPEKTRIMSIMISEKTSEYGHDYRHKIVNRILESNLPIDIYGRGCRFYSFMGDNRVKGEFKELEPYEKYKFHICIENLTLNHYFSEKIMNPLLCNTIPIYMGCRHINDYFEGNTIDLSGNINDDMKLLDAICRNPNHYCKPINVERIKNRIFLLRNIKELFEGFR
jgi:hypothetical protein